MIQMQSSHFAMFPNASKTLERGMFFSIDAAARSVNKRRLCSWLWVHLLTGEVMWLVTLTLVNSDQWETKRCIVTFLISIHFPIYELKITFIPSLSLVSQGWTSDRDYVTMKTSSQNIIVKPAAHSIATQTSQPPSAAAAFFIRSVNATQRKAVTSVSSPYVVVVMRILTAEWSHINTEPVVSVCEALHRIQLWTICA